MRVTLEQSGGFAGLMITKSIETQDLSPPEAQQLEQLVQESNLLNMTSTNEMNPQPDRFSYTISVEANGHTHSVELSETNLPDKVRSLLEWMQSR